MRTVVWDGKSLAAYSKAPLSCPAGDDVVVFAVDDLLVGLIGDESSVAEVKAALKTPAGPLSKAIGADAELIVVKKDGPARVVSKGTQTVYLGGKQKLAIGENKKSAMHLMAENPAASAAEVVQLAAVDTVPEGYGINVFSFQHPGFRIVPGAGFRLADLRSLFDTAASETAKASSDD